MLTFFLITATIIFILLAFAWRSDTWYDSLVKVGLAIVALVGVILLLEKFGYIIKI